MNLNKNYSGKSIRVLDDIEAIRKYPGMYVGSVSNPNHILYEILDNAIDECMMEFCSDIYITINSKSCITIRDNGRGIPIDKHDDGFLACELVFLRTHSGGKFNDNVYQKSGGLHGVGLSAVNALSARLNVKIVRDNKVCFLEFESGVLKSTKVLDNEEGIENGTTIILEPDDSIFETINFVLEDIYSRLQYITYLNSNLRIHYHNVLTGEEELLHHEDGLKGLMNTIITSGVIGDNLYISDIKDSVSAELLFNWSDVDRDEKYIAFTNCIVQKDGGTHVSGVKCGIIKFLNTVKEIEEILSDGYSLVWNDVKHGFRLIINVRIQSPKFDSQSKSRLVSTEVRKKIEQIVFNFINEYYKRNSNLFRKLIKNICDHIIFKHKLGKNENSLSAFLYGGRLVDCRTKDRENAELFLAEGESAGGLVKQCRNKDLQALLTLRGKILNVEKANMKQIINSESLAIIASAIGGSYSADGNVVVESLKYGKIIILVDADVDGSHIRALLLTLFYKHMKEIVLENHIYVVVPPLYRVQIKDTSMYLNKEQELINFLEQHFVSKYFNKFVISDEDNRIIRLLVEAFNKYAKNLSIFLIRIIDVMFILSVWNYNGMIENIKLFEKHIKRMNIFISCYIDNKNNFVIEDCVSVEKITISLEYFNKYIVKIISGFKKYEKNVLHFSINIFNDSGSYLFSYAYNKWCKVHKEIIIQRFKGLGEMNVDQLYETSMNPATRNLRRVVVEDCERATEICNILMGGVPELRRKFIDKNYNLAGIKFDYE